MTNQTYQKEETPLINHHEEEEHEEEEHEEEEPKVSTLELFSDLVIVVSIHVVAEPLEEDGFNQFGLYFARVFFLWLAWHMMTLFMNAAVKQKASNCPFFIFFIFLWMTVILHMAQDFSVNNDKDAIKWYICLRIFETLVYWRQVTYPYKGVMLEDGTKAFSVSNEWLDAMSKYVPVMVLSFIFCELIPLYLATRFGNGTHLDMTMVSLSIGLVLLSFFIGAGVGNRGKMLVNAFDAEHLQERYELITLIFTGELCFAAGKPGNKVGSAGVLSMAFIAYLLTFRSYPLKGHIKFWVRSVLHSVAGLFLYAGVFCAIPAMGSAFARIIEMEEEEEEESAEEVEGAVSAGDLLCFAAGAFMVFSAMINIINVDPKGHHNVSKISSTKRALLRMFTGVLIWSLAFLIPEEMEYKEAPLATLLVPLFALVSTAIEIWAVGSLKPAL